MAADTTGDDEADSAEATEAPAKKKFGLKKILIIAAIPVVLAAAGAGVYFSGLLGGHGKTAEAEKAEKPKEETPGVYLDLPDILVNLEPSGKQPRFLKTSVSLEVGSEVDAETLKKVMPRLVDQFQTYLRGLRVDDLHGSAGVYRLRQELLARVAQAAEPVTVRDVLFRELLVQ